MFPCGFLNFDRGRLHQRETILHFLNKLMTNTLWNMQDDSNSPFLFCSHMMEEEELREEPGPGRADDDPEVTQFYVNPIAKPIPQGRVQTSLQDTISDLNMHKQARNGLEVRSKSFWCSRVSSKSTWPVTVWWAEEAERAELQQLTSL